MKRSDPNEKEKAEVKNSTLNDLLKKGTPKRDEEPTEEFITPDPTRSVPEKNVGLSKMDKMGISQKAKNQSNGE